MPGMNGVEFIHALRQRAELVQDARRLGVAAVVKKPWKPQELAMLVQQACASRRRAALRRRNPSIYRGCFRGVPYPCNPRAGLSSRARKAYGLFPNQLGATGGARSGR